MAKPTVADIRKAIMKALPKDGSSIGNQSMREAIAERLGVKQIDEDDYAEARDALVDAGKAVKGKGRGGSIARAIGEDAGFSLEVQDVPEADKQPKPQQAGLGLHAKKKPGEPAKTARKGGETKIIAYQHEDKRKNNPDVGLVTPETDPEQPKREWKYDPHLDPELQFDSARAQAETLIDDALASGDADAMREALLQLKRMAAPHLNWAGKAERTSFEVDTVSLHVHERIDPATILAAIQKKLQKGKGEYGGTGDMFRAWFEEPLAHREALDFYRHERGWMNRLVAGDSLLVMNSLLQKENMAGRVQMIYIDPPYGIKYGSNFQPFVNKRDVKDRKDEDLTQEPEMIKAFRDTWELGIHSYLTYLRDRLLLVRELLHESGSVFVQIGDENLHLVRQILDEVFGVANFSAQIAFKATDPLGQKGVAKVYDHILWYAKDVGSMKFCSIYKPRDVEDDYEYRFIDLNQGENPIEDRGSAEFLARVYRRRNATSSGFTESCTFDLPFQGISFPPPGKKSWSSNPDGMVRVAKANRLFILGKDPYYKQYQRDFPLSQYENCWTDKPAARGKQYVVETAEKFVERCMLMCTSPGDLVLDPTCGSGTTAYVAEKWGRRWITCDTSRVAVTLAKQRLMTASYDYYELKYPHEGLRGGFIYKTVPHVTLKSIANNPEIDEIHAKLHPPIVSALADLNRALVAGCASAFKVTEGGRKGDAVDFTAPASKTVKLPAGDVVPVNALLEWEVPFDFPAEWPQADRTAFDAFHAARQAMQKRMDASIAAHADQETLYDQPTVSKDKLRITGPFTVEAVPFPTVIALDDAQDGAQTGTLEADASIARSGESARQHGWRDELLKTGIRGKHQQKLEFAELETLPSGPEYRHLNCVGHLKTGERVVVCFGPEHAALEQRHVEMAMREAGELFPRPKMIVFCAFAFDPEAAKDIDATKGITALKAQMNTDLLTEDLKKNRASNQSFWLMGQPEVEVRQNKDGKYVVEVHGFDYFDTVKGTLVSGGKQKIAAWALDTDYDDRSLFPRQVFFPMAGAKDGWYKLKKDIKAELNEALLDKLHGTVSLPFDAGDNRRIAVKIVDDRGIESLKVMTLE